MQAPKQTLTIFFADIANSTRLFQEQGDVVAHRLIVECLSNLRQTVEMHKGTLLRTVGDAVLASFDGAHEAMLAAVASQRMQLNSPLSIRVGFHTGDVIPDSGDVYGNAVNIAARVADFANATEIYTTEDTVRGLTRQQQKATKYLDHVEFKGIQERLAVYRVQWEEDSTTRPARDTRIITAVNRSIASGADRTLYLSSAMAQITVDKDTTLVRIGREVDNDIVIEHESTSRHHANVEYLRGRYFLNDSSTNGTYLIRSDGNAVFVRRETVELDREGIIGVGWHPSAGDKNCIQFRSVG